MNAVIFDFPKAGSNPLKRRLEESGFRVELKTAATFEKNNSSWERDYQLVVLPPGSAGLLMSQLGCFKEQKSDTIACRIKRYVEESGGSLFGVCAGAMAMTDAIVYSDEGGSLYVLEPGLGIVRGTSMHYRYWSGTLHMVPFQIEKTVISAPYMDGPCFMLSDSAAKVCGSYKKYPHVSQFQVVEDEREIASTALSMRLQQEETPGIVVKAFSSGGKAILSGVHIECHSDGDIRALYPADSISLLEFNRNIPVIQTVWQTVIDQLG